MSVLTVASVLGSLESVFTVIMGVEVGREVLDAPREKKIGSSSLLDRCDSAKQDDFKASSCVVRRDPLTSL